MSDDTELLRLRTENAALNEQVKLLVQMEQRLYRTQNAREHEIRRIRAVGAFALDVVSAPRERVLERTLEVLHQCFALDAAAVVAYSTDHSMTVRSAQGTRAVVLSERALGVLGRLTTVTMRTVGPTDDTDGTTDILSAIGFPPTGLCTLIPVEHGIAVAALSTPRKRPVYREDPLTEQHVPLVQLIGSHVQRVIEHSVLTEHLKARSHSLAEVNARLEESLRTIEQTQARLMQVGKMEAIGRLAGGVAHDFNNLLTVILNYASLVERSLPEGSPATEDLRYVMDAGHQASEITSQLLALGRKSVQRREHVDLSAIARDLGRILHGLLGRMVTFEVVAEPRCVIFADRTQIEQVILNLVINARDAMPDGGVVRVVTRSATAAEIAGVDETGLPDGWVALEVNDTGLGMDAATQASIFEPFFTTKEAGQGTGLGLAVVYGVIQQSEGFISVASTPGEGSRFTVLLPRGGDAVDKVRAPKNPIAPGARVMVVEDSAAIRRVTSRILTRAGCQVTEAVDGMEALELMATRSADFDLVITDLNMPRMGGFELLHELTRIMPQCRVLFMTGYSDELSDVSRRAPNIACLTKPFTPDQLLSKVAAHLATRPSEPPR